jgi:hypothetical protein
MSLTAALFSTTAQAQAKSAALQVHRPALRCAVLLIIKTWVLLI